MTDADLLLTLLRDGSAAAVAAPAWERVVALAHREGVAPLLHARLTREPANVPAAIRARLRALHERTWARNSVLLACWHDVVTATETAGIRPLALKGMALVQEVYDDPGLRPMADLDVLVPAADFPRARTALLHAGWAAADGEDEAANRARGYAHLRRGGAVLDLHGDIVSYPRVAAVMRVDQDALWRGARRLPAGGYVLAMEDQLVHLAVHTVLGSEFGRLLNYVDVDRVVRGAPGGVAWDAVVASAERWRMRGVVGYVLNVAAATLGTPVPPAVIARLRAAASTRLLRRIVATDRPPSLAAPPGLAALYVAETLLMDRWRSVLRVAATTLFPPASWLRFHYGARGARAVWAARALHPLRVCALAARARH